MASIKKSFFGSLFSFQPIAVEEVRNQFEQACKRNGLAGDPPLVSYDQETLSFLVQCDQTETRFGQLFGKLLGDYIRDHQAEVDLLEKQRLVPVPGTLIDDSIASHDLFSLDNDEGLVPFSDEEDSEDEDRTVSPVGYNTEVWRPAKGNVGLLPFDVVKALSDKTGCTFSVNPLSHEVRLVDGNLSDALCRLSALDAILSYLQHPANAHVLVLYAATDSTRIDFTKPSDSALRRIIVDPDVKSVEVWLGNKRIEQLATYIKSAKAEQAFVTPNNLRTSSQCSTNIETSGIWSDFTFARIGDAKNEAMQGGSSRSGTVEKLDPLPISHYMTETESQMIEQWAGRVVETADPNVPIPEAPLEDEGQKRVGMTRRVKKVEDDDDEEDEEDEEGQEGNTMAIPIASKSMNDALNSQFDAQKAKLGRIRVKKIDEDEDEDESADDRPITVKKMDEDEDEDESADDRPISTSDNKPNTWIYPPAAELNAGRSRNLRAGKIPRRQRVVRRDSDEEDEDKFPATSHLDEHKSGDWARSFPVIPLRNNVDTTEMLDDWGVNDLPQVSTQVLGEWDDTVYPTISSSFGAIDNPSERKQTLFDSAELAPWEKDPSLDRRSVHNLTLKTGDWSDFTAETSKGGRGKDSPERGGSYGRGSRDRGGGPARDAQTIKVLSSHGRCRGSGQKTSRESSHQHQDHSNRRGTQGSKDCIPSGPGGARDYVPERGGNRYGALATDALVDITLRDTGEEEAVASPLGSGHSQPAQHHSIAGRSYHAPSNSSPGSAELIDVSTPEKQGDKPVTPPPGFQPSGDNNILRQNSNQHFLTSVGPEGIASDIVGPQSMPSLPNTGEFYVETSNPGMDLIEMSRRRVEQLHKAREEASLHTTAEKLQDFDDSSTRTFRTTMNQQAKKPEQKKEVKQRRAEVLREAWDTGNSSGQAKPSNGTPAPPPRKAQMPEISAAKKSLLRNRGSMANSGPQGASEEQTDLQTAGFITALKPIFKAAKAFPGSLQFEVQLGQFLSPSPDGAYQSKCVTVSQWHKLYASPDGRLASATSFTNILTRNGADVDYMLKLKSSKGGERIFHHDDPGRSCVCFEFLCQGKNNDEFKLVFDPKGQHEIRRPFRKIGQVNLHVPGQVWDAAGMFTGSTRFTEELALKEAADELAKSLYIPEGRKQIEISYRLPSSNEFAVKRVVMRRISRHRCAIMDKDDIQLQISEVQRLFVDRRSGGIYLAYGSRYEKMVDQMMIHFEVSLVSESIERAMSANAELAVGDVTTAWTEDSLLQNWRIKNLLQIVQLLVSKIDGVGFHNVGSAVFFLGQHSVLAGGSGVAIGSRVQNQSIIKLANQNVHAVINVPGVRGGLAQHIKHGYALGYGGAQVPIPELDDPDGLEPEDSASQGAPRADTNAQVKPGFW